MSVREAIPAVVTTDRRLDQAGAVAVPAAGQRQKHMTGVRAERRRAGQGIDLGATPPPDDVTHELTQFGLVHVLALLLHVH